MSKPTLSASPKQARKPQRFARLCREADTGDLSLVIRQVQPSGKTTTDVYGVREIGTDEPTARAFALTKPDGTVYSCEVSGGFNSCDCKGHSRHDHCKHVSALTALLNNSHFGGFPEPRVEDLSDEQVDAMAEACGYDAVLDAA